MNDTGDFICYDVTKIFINICQLTMKKCRINLYLNIVSIIVCYEYQ